MSRVLIVEDEDAIAEIEKDSLELSGFEVVIKSDGTSGLATALEEEFDIMILDVMLPDRDGLSILRDLRTGAGTAKIPIIMVTAKTTEMDKVKGLDQGADDYITKPFGIMELISRVKAVLRRAGLDDAAMNLEFEGIVLDDAKHQVTIDGNPCELTFKEYELLKMLMQNSGIVLQRGQILDRVWGIDYEGESRTLDMHIKTLRKKMDDKGTLVQTVRNVGYTLNYRKDR